MVCGDDVESIRVLVDLVDLSIVASIGPYLILLDLLLLVRVGLDADGLVILDELRMQGHNFPQFPCEYDGFSRQQLDAQGGLLMLLEFLAKFLWVVNVNIEFLDVLPDLSYFLLELKGELLLVFELEEDDGVRLLVLNKEGEEGLFVVVVTIHRVYGVAGGSLDDLFEDGEVTIVDEDGSSCEDCEVVPVDGKDGLDCAEFVLDVHLVKCMLFLIGRVLQQISVLITEDHHVQISLSIGIYVFYGLKALNSDHPDYFQAVPVQHSKVGLVQSNKDMGFIGRDGTDFDVLVVKVVLQRNFSEAFLAVDLLAGQVVLVEDVVGAVVEGGEGEVQALRLEPIW